MATVKNIFDYKGIEIPGPTWNMDTDEFTWDTTVPEELYVEILFGIKPKDTKKIDDYLNKLQESSKQKGINVNIFLNNFAKIFMYKFFHQIT